MTSTGRVKAIDGGARGVCCAIISINIQMISRENGSVTYRK